MRLTVDIDDRKLARLQKATGIRKKAPAVKTAVDDYLYGLERRRFLQRVCEGRTDYSTSNEQIETIGSHEPDTY